MTSVTDLYGRGDQTTARGAPLPILFMALLALAVFLVMGGLVFYAAYAESHTPHKDDAAKPAARP